MKKNILLLSITVLLSCNLKQGGQQNKPSKEQLEIWKSEIVKTEEAFNDLAQKEGLSVAFKTYAAPDGVISRRRKIIRGKDSIALWYKENPRPDQTLTWKPDFVNVSTSGDLGYTYGTAIFTTTDSLGNKTVRKAKFHTVWERQADGTWRFVWD